MATYKITSTAGVEMGTYEAETHRLALDAMARDAGYRDELDARSVGGRFEGVVEDVESGEVYRFGAGSYR